MKEISEGQAKSKFYEKILEAYLNLRMTLFEEKKLPSFFSQKIPILI